jgi:hemolysin activation/secretion protein
VGRATISRPPPMTVSRRARAALLALAFALPAPSAVAQGVLGVEPGGRSGEPPPLLREAPRPEPPATPLLPPLPPGPLEPGPGERVFVRRIVVTGSTVFSPAELAAVTAPYVDREVSAEDLEMLRVALTRLYVDRGYVNSGAVLPDQTVTDGVITFAIVEGRLTDIEIRGNRWFRDRYLRERLRLGAGPPLNADTLQRRLQLLLEDQRLRRLNAELRPGLAPGDGVLDVLVEEARPYGLFLEFNNYQSPTIGAERGLVTLQHQNLTGNGDVLTLRYGRSDGADPQLDFRYAFPLTARDLTLIAHYRKNDFAVVEEPFRDLEIESRSELFGLTLRAPVLRTLNHQVALELAGERLTNETFLLDRPFTLAPGARRGESTVTAVRVAQEWVYRTERQVVAARSRFSVGVDALGATINPSDVPDGQFFAWLGQFQFVRRLPILDAQVIARADLQLAADPLLSLEQIAVGGRYTVRGYRENTLVRDNGFVASLEARVPVVRNVRWADSLEVAPFVDYGRGWNNTGPKPEVRSIPSVGLGLRWTVTLRAGPATLQPQLEVYWGRALRDVETPGGNLQDEGVHLQFVLAAF